MPDDQKENLDKSKDSLDTNIISQRREDLLSLASPGEGTLKCLKTTSDQQNLDKSKDHIFRIGH